MNLKCPIPTTKEGLRRFLKYVETSGFDVTREYSHQNHHIWHSADAPGYSETPLAEQQGEKCWVYIRLPKDEPS